MVSANGDLIDGDASTTEKVVSASLTGALTLGSAITTAFLSRTPQGILAAMLSAVIGLSGAASMAQKGLTASNVFQGAMGVALPWGNTAAEAWATRTITPFPKLANVELDLADGAVTVDVTIPKGPLNCNAACVLRFSIGATSISKGSSQSVPRDGVAHPLSFDLTADELTEVEIFLSDGSNATLSARVEQYGIDFGTAQGDLDVSDSDA